MNTSMTLSDASSLLAVLAAAWSIGLPQAAIGQLPDRGTLRLHQRQRCAYGR